MKKSLILSIVMTLVLVLSMSTATFAWYTASNQAVATVSTITAATASGDLQVAFTSNSSGADPTGGYYNISYTAIGTKNPTAPTEVLSANTVETATWIKGSIDANGEEGSDFMSTNANYQESEYGVITLSNKSTTATKDITMSVEITGDLADKAEVLVVCGNDIIYNTAYSYGTGKTTVTSAENINTGEIDAIGGGLSITVKYYIWLDGYNMTNPQMGKTFNVKFTFNAAE